MKKYIAPTIIFLLILFLYSTVLFFIVNNRSEVVLAEKGQVKLNITKDKTILIEGEAEFFINELLYTEPTNLNNKIVIPLNTTWENSKISELKNVKYGSYKMQISVDSLEEMSVELKDILTSYNLYWNGQLIGKMGQVSSDKNTAVAENNPARYPINDIKWTNELVIEVSDYNLGEGGINHPIRFGKTKTLANELLINIALNTIIIATIFSLSVIFMLDSSAGLVKKINLSLAFLLFIFFLRSITIGERIIRFAFPNISWDSIYRIETLTVILSIAVLIRLLSHTTKEKILKKVAKFISISTRFVIISILILPPIYVRMYAIEFIYFLMIALIFMISYMTKLKLYKDLTIRFIFYSTSVLIVTGILDILLRNSGGKYVDITDLGLILFGYIMLFSDFRTRNENIIHQKNLQEELIKSHNRLKLMNIELERKVQERTKSIEEKNYVLEQLSKTDSLTGLLNHKSILELASEHFNNHNICISMIDIDNFKRINDNYGHQIGDELLKEFSMTLSHTIRSKDLVGRYGGEEFIIILTDIKLEDAYSIIERIHSKVSKLSFTEKNIKLTFSAGIDSSDNFETTEKLIYSADSKLYEAKESGRNKIVY